ncbi:MAG: cytochrome c, partial [Gammaproteobacteria bacterium]|nr:cytochrome c [Gammaproteobacteria bacterium]
MSSWVNYLSLLLAFLLVACGDEMPMAVTAYGLGSPVTENEIASWDIDVGPDGVGLPVGSGSAQSGESVYLAKCAACHGDFGEGMGRFPALVGSPEILVSERPSKSVGSYWAHSTTLYDYIYRAMPFGNAQSLSADEVYGITAYILNLNDIIADDAVMDASSLPQVQMPNRNGFITATGPDITVEACMQDCVDEVKV